MNQITGWKAVVGAIVIVALVGLRVASRMNRWAKNDQPANPGQPMNADEELPPVTRGQDFVIDGVAKIPTAAGFTWAVASSHEGEGPRVTSYIGTSAHQHTALTLAVMQDVVTGNSERAKVINQFRLALIKSLEDYGARSIGGDPPTMGATVPDRVTFALSGIGPTGVPTEVRAVIFFGKSTYLITAQTPDKQDVEALIQMTSDITELGPPANAVAADDSTRPAEPAPGSPRPGTDGSASNAAPPVTPDVGASSAAPDSVPSKATAPPPVEDVFQVVELPAPVFDTAAAAEGRLLVLHLSGADELAILDLATRQIAARIPAPQEALIAAGKDDLVVVTPADRKITRWSLESFESEASAMLDVDGEPQAIAMGYASQGPILIHWSSPGARFPQYGLIDLQTFKVQQLTSPDGTPGPGQVHLNTSAGVELRAAADSRVFGLRPSIGSSTIMERLFVGPIPTSVGETTGSGGHVIPSADGRILCTGQGFFSASLTQRSTTSGTPCFPTCDARYFLSLNDKGLEVRDVLSGNTVHTLPPLKELGNEFLSDCQFGFRKERQFLMPDQRIHCVPAADLLVTIPAGGDRLVIREIPFSQFSESPSAGEPDVIPMPGGIASAISAGGGRYAILHIPERGVAVVVDLPQRRIAGTITAPQDALIAAGKSKVVVITALNNRVTRWSLEPVEEEHLEPLDLKGQPRAVAMGHASDGPALVYWTNDKGGAFSLLDIDLLDLKPLSNAPREPAKQGEITVRITGESYGGAHIRAAADSRKFGVWHSNGSPTGVEVITLGRTPAAKYEHDSHGHVIPTAQGRVLTGNGTYLANLEFAKDGNHPFFPTSDPRFMLSLSPEAVELRTIATGKVVQQIPALADLDKDFIYRCGFGNRKWAFSLMEDQRLFCLPGDQLVAIIPLTDDRIVIRNVTFDLPASSEQPDADRVADAPAPDAPTTPPAPATHTNPATPAATTPAADAARAEKARVWTDKSGNFKITATLVSVTEKDVVLKKPDGTEITVAIDQLSAIDAAYARKRQSNE
jgi:hypothetical protein